MMRSPADQPDEVVVLRRLQPHDRDLARRLFALVAEVFEEPGAPLSDSYLDGLLGRPDFWALVALERDEVIGGITAHTLPMTRAERAELFVYDVAVHPDHQRRGVGRQLVAALRAAARGEVFVLADMEDGHALDFYHALGGQPTEVMMYTFPADEA